jgi:hypothetical protein
VGHSLSCEQIWKLVTPVQADAATHFDPVKSSTYSYGASVPPSAAHPGWAFCSSSFPAPQQMSVPVQSGVPSHCQSTPPDAHAVAIAWQTEPPDDGSQQCSVVRVQYWSFPPSVVSLNGQ